MIVIKDFIDISVCEYESLYSGVSASDKSTSPGGSHVGGFDERARFFAVGTGPVPPGRHGSGRTPSGGGRRIAGAADRATRQIVARRVPVDRARIIAARIPGAHRRQCRDLRSYTGPDSGEIAAFRRLRGTGSITR